uniref:Uncharacterized protein n=1 Tax=Arundo donax TaxID=35708 RepID=A0A0A8YFN3_ARUDO
MLSSDPTQVSAPSRQRLATPWNASHQEFSCCIHSHYHGCRHYLLPEQWLSLLFCFLFSQGM